MWCGCGERWIGKVIGGNFLRVYRESAA